jgi:hypothetical protein
VQQTRRLPHWSRPLLLLLLLWMSLLLLAHPSCLLCCPVGAQARV